MPDKNRVPAAHSTVQIHVRGQRIQGSTRQYVNQIVAISPPRISGSLDEKLAVLDSLGVLSGGRPNEVSRSTPSTLATAAGFIQLEYQRKYPYWTSTDILD